MKKFNQRFKILFFCFCLVASTILGQDNYYFVAETKTDEDGSGLLKHQATYTVSFFNDVIQTIYEDAESTEYRYYSEDTVYIYYKNISGKEITGMGTGAEMKKYLNKQIDHKKKNVKIVNTGKSEVVMGLLCDEILLSYEYKYFGMVFEFENSIWFSNEIKVNSELITADITNIWVKNNYTDSLKKINGFVVKQTIKRDSNLLATLEVKAFERLDKDEFKSEHFILKTRKIKKLKPCMQEIEAYRNRKDAFERLNATQK